MLLWISLGAIPGALIRWQIENDLIVNTCGSLILGFVIACELKKHYKIIFSLGLCGSLTTFSGWISKSLSLLISGDIILFFIFVISTILLGIFACALGFILGKLFILRAPFLLPFLIHRWRALWHF